MKAFIEKHTSGIVLALIILAAGFAVYAALLSTPFGPAFGSDSVTYMESARNFVAGRGLGLINPDGSFRLLPYAPPLFPLVLSIFALLRIDLISSAFWMNILLYGVTIFLLSWGVWRYFRSALAAILLAALMALSVVLIELYGWIMSDALCLALGVGSLLTLLAYLRNGSRESFFWSAILAGLAFLTRYAGVAYCITGAMGVILFGSKPLKKRLVAGSLYGLVSILPNLGWLAIELPMAGAVGSRSLLPLSELLPGSIEVLRSLKEAIYLWVPYFLPLSQSIGQVAFRLLYGGLLVIILVAVVFAFRKLRRNDPADWRWSSAYIPGGIILLFLAVYLVVLIPSYALIYPHLSLGNRMFAPINVALLVLVSLVIGLLFRAYRAWLPRIVTLTLAVVLVAAFIGGAREGSARFRLYPPGYAGFNGTDFVTYLQTLPADIPLISDKATLVLHYTGRPAYAIQEFFSVEGQSEFLPYGSDPQDEAQRAFREQGGALILTRLVQTEFTGLYGELADERYAAFVDGLYLAYNSPDGKVYYFQPPTR